MFKEKISKNLKLIQDVSKYLKKSKSNLRYLQITQKFTHITNISRNFLGDLLNIIMNEQWMNFIHVHVKDDVGNDDSDNVKQMLGMSSMTSFRYKKYVSLITIDNK
jgi:uncharacterized HAD superfamily protein